MPELSVTITVEREGSEGSGQSRDPHDVYNCEVSVCNYVGFIVCSSACLC